MRWRWRSCWGAVVVFRIVMKGNGEGCVFGGPTSIVRAGERRFGQRRRNMFAAVLFSRLSKSFCNCVRRSFNRSFRPV